MFSGSGRIRHCDDITLYGGKLISIENDTVDTLYHAVFSKDITSIPVESFSMTKMKHQKLLHNFQHVNDISLHWDKRYKDSMNHIYKLHIVNNDNKVYRLELSHVYIGKSIENIGCFAFHKNMFLSSVHFSPESKIRSFSYGVFQQCTALQNIILPPNLENIDSYAFANTALRSITISSNIISQHVFNDCIHLHTIIFKKPKLRDKCLQILDNVFVGCSALTKIVLPANVSLDKINYIPSCKNVTWVVSQEEFGCDYKEKLIYKIYYTLEFIFINAKHTIVCDEDHFEKLEFLLMLTSDIDVYDWNYLSMSVCEYLEDIS